MASITIRNLDDDVKERLQLRAAEHGRSMEAEIRTILTDAVTQTNVKVVAEAPVLVVHQSDEILAGMDNWNKSTHSPLLRYVTTLRSLMTAHLPA